MSIFSLCILNLDFRSKEKKNNSENKIIDTDENFFTIQSEISYLNFGQKKQKKKNRMFFLTCVE